MADCPYCDSGLRETTLGRQPAQSCPSCGGTWISAAALAQAVQDSPADLAPYSDRWLDNGGRPPLSQAEPLCTRCGQPLRPRSFPIAPSMLILSCAGCRQLLLAAGQLRQLHGVVAPESLPPVAEPPRVAPEPALPDASLTAPPELEPEPAAGFSLWESWGPRDPTQPWLAWLVLGVPYGLICLGMLALGVFYSQTGEALVAKMLPAWPSGYAWVMVPGVFVVWGLYTLQVCIVLQLIWRLVGETMPLGFGETFMLLLKVTAFMIAVQLATVWLLDVTGQSRLWRYLVSSAMTIVVYRNVIELEWAEIRALWMMNMLCCGFGGL